MRGEHGAEQGWALEHEKSFLGTVLHGVTQADGDQAELKSHSLSTDLRCILGQHPCGAPASSKPGRSQTAGGSFG